MTLTDGIRDEELEEIRLRVSHATAGPWRAMIEGRDHTSGDSFILVGEGDGRKDMYVSFGETPAPAEDLDFIASARQDVPRLVEELLRLRDGGHGNP